MTPAELRHIRAVWAEPLPSVDPPEPDHVALVEELEAIQAALAEVPIHSTDGRTLGLAEQVELLVAVFRELDEAPR